MYQGSLGGGGTIKMHRPNMTNVTTVLWQQSMWSGNDNIVSNGGALHNSATAFDGFKVTATPGFSGTLRVYGLRNSV
jgi:hypothetical protein